MIPEEVATRGFHAESIGRPVVHMRGERRCQEIARSAGWGYDPDPARQPESPVSLIHTSSLPDVEIPEMSITDYVFHKAAAYPDRIAVSDGAGNQYTFNSRS